MSLKKAYRIYFPKIIETDSILNFAQTNIKQNSYLITLEIEGKSLSSPEFAQKIKGN